MTVYYSIVQYIIVYSILYNFRPSEHRNGRGDSKSSAYTLARRPAEGIVRLGMRRADGMTLRRRTTQVEHMVLVPSGHKSKA